MVARQEAFDGWFCVGKPAQLCCICVGRDMQGHVEVETLGVLCLQANIQSGKHFMKYTYSWFMK